MSQSPAERRRFHEVVTRLEGTKSEARDLTDALLALQPRPTAPPAQSQQQQSRRGYAKGNQKAGGQKGKGGRNSQPPPPPPPPPTAAELLRQKQQEEQQRQERRRGGGSGGAGDGEREGEVKLPHEWRAAIAAHLQQEHPQAHKQLVVPKGWEGKQGYLWDLWLKGSFSRGAVAKWEKERQRRLSGARGKEEAWEEVGVGAEAKERREASRKWGADVDPREEPEVLEDVWKLPMHLRARLAAVWREGARAEVAEQLAAVLEKVGQLQVERGELADGAKEALLKKVGRGWGWRAACGGGDEVGVDCCSLLLGANELSLHAPIARNC